MFSAGLDGDSVTSHQLGRPLTSIVSQEDRQIGVFQETISVIDVNSMVLEKVLSQYAVISDVCDNYVGVKHLVLEFERKEGVTKRLRGSCSNASQCGGAGLESGT